MIEGHSKDEVDARLEETVGVREALHFTFTAADQRADHRLTRLRTTTLVHTDTQVY